MLGLNPTLQRRESDIVRPSKLTRLSQFLPYSVKGTHAGFDVAHEVADHASGRRDGRPTFRLLWEPPRRRQADVVLTRHYDRFARSARAMRADRTALTSFSVEIGQGVALKRSQQLS